MIVGAILTQSTAWTNVEKALRRLKNERAIRLEPLHNVKTSVLAQWIRPAGYFNVKAQRLRSFTDMVAKEFNGRLNKLFRLETEDLRKTLLGVNGIGPETADSILLYAANRPVFVVDAYTRRMLFRHGWISKRATYDEIAKLFTSTVSPDVQTYNEYHALIVRLGKEFCRPKPLCGACPLRRWLPTGGARQ